MLAMESGPLNAMSIPSPAADELTACAALPRGIRRCLLERLELLGLEQLDPLLASSV